jgi:hypothetical protein
MRGKTCSPSFVIRNVCSPGIDARPRIFSIWIFRTTELRSATCDSQNTPSATVKRGLRCSCSLESPMMYDVTSHEIISTAIRCTKSSRLSCPPEPEPEPCAIAVRNESTTTTRGRTRSTSSIMRSSTTFRSWSAASALRFTY